MALSALRAGLLALFALAAPAVVAEPVSLTLKLVDEAGRPLARHATRIAIGSDAEVSAPGAGRRLSSDRQGVVRTRVEASPERRTITSTSRFARHPAEHLVVGEGAVLAMGVFISASTKIVDRATGQVHIGKVPPYSVVVSGSLPGKPMNDGTPGPALYCAVIVKTVDAQTRAKTGINDLLRD